MKLLPRDLENNGYLLLDKLELDDLLPFVRKYLKEKTFFSFAYLGINLLLLFVIVVKLVLLVQSEGNRSLDSAITHLSIGLAVAFALLPLHEYIHVLAYRSQGAKNTSYDVNLKKFIFMALADKFVASKKEFLNVAIAPFAVISLVCLSALLFLPGNYFYIALGTLLTHSAFCSGDFALMSYFEFHKDKEVVTYDDVANKVAYFYAREKRAD